MNYTTDDNFVVDQVFRIKGHLKWVVHDFHIRVNLTFHVKKDQQTSVYCYMHKPELQMEVVCNSSKLR
jgi:hypothetical protein